MNADYEIITETQSHRNRSIYFLIILFVLNIKRMPFMEVCMPISNAPLDLKMYIGIHLNFQIQQFLNFSVFLLII